VLDAKLIEVRDSMTTIPALAWKPDPSDEAELWFWSRSGFGRTPGDYVFLMRLSDQETKIDPYGWGHTRTMPTVHRHLMEHWDLVRNGDVIDVQFLLGETTIPKESERPHYNLTGL